MTTTSMTEVLAEHRFTLDYWGDPSQCQCGSDVRTQEQMDAHVAQGLADAGFVHVASVERCPECSAPAYNEAGRQRARAEDAEAKVAVAKDEGAAEALDALRERLVTAEQQLRELAPTFWESVERERVSGKAQGMQLALSYVDEIARLREQVGE